MLQITHLSIKITFGYIKKNATCFYFIKIVANVKSIYNNIIIIFIIVKQCTIFNSCSFCICASSCISALPPLLPLCFFHSPLVFEIVSVILIWEPPCLSPICWDYRCALPFLTLGLLFNPSDFFLFPESLCMYWFFLIFPLCGTLHFCLLLLIL